MTFTRLSVIFACLTATSCATPATSEQSNPSAQTSALPTSIWQTSELTSFAAGTARFPDRVSYTYANIAFDANNNPNVCFRALQWAGKDPARYDIGSNAVFYARPQTSDVSQAWFGTLAEYEGSNAHTVTVDTGHGQNCLLHLQPQPSDPVALIYPGWIDDYTFDQSGIDKRRNVALRQGTLVRSDNTITGVNWNQEQDLFLIDPNNNFEGHAILDIASTIDDTGQTHFAYREQVSSGKWSLFYLPPGQSSNTWGPPLLVDADAQAPRLSSQFIVFNALGTLPSLVVRNGVAHIVYTGGASDTRMVKYARIENGNLASTYSTSVTKPSGGWDLKNETKQAPTAAQFENTEATATTQHPFVGTQVTATAHKAQSAASTSTQAGIFVLGIGANPTVAVDSAGNVHVGYLLMSDDGPGGYPQPVIKTLKKDANVFSPFVSLGAPFTGLGITLIIEPQSNRAHLAYFSDRILYATKSDISNEQEPWLFSEDTPEQTTNLFFGERFGLAIDASSKPGLAWVTSDKQAFAAVRSEQLKPLGPLSISFSAPDGSAIDNLCPGTEQTIFALIKNQQGEVLPTEKWSYVWTLERFPLALIEQV